MAQKVKIPIVNFNAQTDETALNGSSSRIVDGYIEIVDNSPYLNKRYGIKELSHTGVELSSSRIKGMFYWTNKDLVLIVSNQKLYVKNSSNVISLIGSGLGNDKAYFAIVRIDGRECVAVANGGLDVYIYDPDSAPIWKKIRDYDANCPTNIKTIAYFDGYLIVLPKDSIRFYYSNFLEPLIWSTLDFYESEYKADNINFLATKQNYIYLFGNESIEVLYNTGLQFARVDGGQIDVGCIAPDSISIVDNNFIFLDSLRRIVILNGQTAQIISQNVGKLVSEIGKNDCFSQLIELYGKRFFIITFPTATRTIYDGSSEVGITLVYDIQIQQWYEWATFHPNTAGYGLFDFYAYCFDISNNKFILGRYSSNNQIFEFDNLTYLDGGDFIRTMWISGYIDHGSSNKKRNNRLQWRMKNGTSVNTTEIELNYKNDGESAWKSERNITLQVGATVPNQQLVNTSSLGMYRTRQWKLTSSSLAPLVLGEIEETLDLMGK